MSGFQKNVKAEYTDLIHHLMRLGKIIPKQSFKVRGGGKGREQSIKLVGGREEPRDEWLTMYNNQERVLL